MALDATWDAKGQVWLPQVAIKTMTRTREVLKTTPPLQVWIWNMCLKPQNPFVYLSMGMILPIFITGTRQNTPECTISVECIIHYSMEYLLIVLFELLLWKWIRCFGYNILQSWKWLTWLHWGSVFRIY